jgi:hypothetical protein
MHVITPILSYGTEIVHQSVKHCAIPTSHTTSHDSDRNHTCIKQFYVHDMYNVFKHNQFSSFNVKTLVNVQ